MTAHGLERRDDFFADDLLPRDFVFDRVADCFSGPRLTGTEKPLGPAPVLNTGLLLSAGEKSRHRLIDAAQDDDLVEQSVLIRLQKRIVLSNGYAAVRRACLAQQK